MSFVRRLFRRVDGGGSSAGGLLGRFRRFQESFRPRISMRIWLTALFLLVTAFAGGLTYDIVRPILYNTLNQASQASVQQVGEQFENELQRDPDLTVARIQDFATSRGLQWGIVRAEDGSLLQGDVEDWHPTAVGNAVETETPQQERRIVQAGPREGQLLATYAAPINVPGQEETAIVFTQYFTESDVGNVTAAVERIERIALLAGALALLIAGISGYVVANLISHRVSRLGVAAEHLASGNFNERIGTRIEDEIGALGDTFNSMAASLKSAFRQVEQEKERGQAILDGMTDAVVGVDGELNTIFLNPRARELLGSSDLAFHDRLQHILARSLREGPVTEPEAETNPEGRLESWNQILEVRAAPLEEGALAILRDVTQERRIARAKAEFIANASHELKTPLFALSGYLEMLEDEEDEEVRNAFLKDMRAQTGRLQSLARTLLDLSRLDANAVTFRLEEVELEELLHDLRRDFSYTGRRIELHADEVTPVETDPTQLHRVLAILLDNALKYSPEGSPVDLGLRREHGRAVVSVADRGCGIPEEDLPYIFDRFYRAHGSSRADGTGLGLALAHEIADHLGGEILVESEPDAGSTFSVSLPLSPVDERREISSPGRHNVAPS